MTNHIYTLPVNTQITLKENIKTGRHYPLPINPTFISNNAAFLYDIAKVVQIILIE